MVLKCLSLKIDCKNVFFRKKSIFPTENLQRSTPYKDNERNISHEKTLKISCCKEDSEQVFTQ